MSSAVCPTHSCGRHPWMARDASGPRLLPEGPRALPSSRPPLLSSATEEACRPRPGPRGPLPQRGSNPGSSSPQPSPATPGPAAAGSQVGTQAGDGAGPGAGGGPLRAGRGRPQSPGAPGARPLRHSLGGQARDDAKSLTATTVRNYYVAAATEPRNSVWNLESIADSLSHP